MDSGDSCSVFSGSQPAAYFGDPRNVYKGHRSVFPERLQQSSGLQGETYPISGVYDQFMVACSRLPSSSQLLSLERGLVLIGGSWFPEGFSAVGVGTL